MLARLIIRALAYAKYDDIDFAPPKGVRAEAKRGLEWRREYKRGGTEVGVARARDLAGGRNISSDTARRMKATPLDLLREGRFEEIDISDSPVASPRPRPLSAGAKLARAPQSPESLVGARSERVHVKKGKLIAAVPIKLTRSK
jgi:hypothetical protein